MGPNFHPPPAPTVNGYVEHPLRTTASTPGVSGGTSQAFVIGADIQGDWWTLFHSQALDTLVEAAIKNNHDLKAARAALVVARQNLLAQRGAFFPAVSAGFAASRNRASEDLAPVPNFPVVPQEFAYSLFTPQLTISYAPDVFGLTRRTHESLQAAERAARFQMIAAWNTLATNVVVTAVEEASLSEQVAASHRLDSLERRSLAIIRLRFKRGDASELAVAAQQSQLAQLEATLPALEKALAQTRHALAALTGRWPDEGPVAVITLAELHLPRKLPLSLPSRLVAQRPDVRQARATLHAASAAVGIAAAQRLPNIELSANVGSTALAISRVFASGTGFWGLAASITAPIFEGGTLAHEELAAKAAYVEAAQAYRSTVLAAFRNVADTLAALEDDAKSLRASAAAEQAAKRALDLSQLELHHGYVGEYEMIAAEQSYETSRIGLAQAEVNRFADTAALYQALGGGWWHHGNLAGSRDLVN